VFVTRARNSLHYLKSRLVFPIFISYQCIPSLQGARPLVFFCASAAIRMLYDFLVVRQLVPVNPSIM
jgi:hypothetical protein